MKDKRGMEMAVTTVIMIVLSISILTVLLLFWNSQTGVFSRFAKTYNTESNVDAFVGNCNSLLGRESYYAFCCEGRDAYFGKDVAPLKTTCGEAVDLEWAGGRIESYDCSTVGCAE